MENFVGRASALITDAQAAEQQGKFQEAVHAYINGIEWLQAAIKYEQNAQIKETLKKKALAYAERAEKLKEMMNKEPQTTAPISSAPTASEKHDAENTSRARALVLSEKVNVRWEDVAGLDAVKSTLRQATVLPLCMPQLFADGRVEAWKGVLLFGPPGTGKTLLAKAVATEAAGSTFINVRIADIMNKYVGESERNVKAIFELARKEAPTVVFMDEIDCIMGARDEKEHEASLKVKNQLLQELDGLGTNADARVLVLAATNRPQSLDTAFLRRMQRRVYVPLPDEDARRAMIQAHARKSTFSLNELEIDLLVAATVQWSGSDIATLVRAAQNHQLHLLDRTQHFVSRDGKLYPCSSSESNATNLTLQQIVANGDGEKVALPPVSYADFEAVLPTTRPSTPIDALRQYEEFAASQGSGNA